MGSWLASGALKRREQNILVEMFCHQPCGITVGPFGALIVGMDSSPESDVIVLMWDHNSVFQSAERKRGGLMEILTHYFLNPIKTNR